MDDEACIVCMDVFYIKVSIIDPETLEKMVLYHKATDEETQSS
jgi:hypothetical protein